MNHSTKSINITRTSKRNSPDDDDWNELMSLDHEDTLDIEYQDEDEEDEEEVKPSKRRIITPRTTTTKSKTIPSSNPFNPVKPILIPRPHSETYHQPLPSLLNSNQSQIGLLDWFDKVRDHRGMPWRKRYDPLSTIEEKGQRAYEIWVSEVMLQQTQVTTVIPYWQRWISKWPTISDLAQADIEQVNSQWRGLGYYRRARGLLEGAKRVHGDFERYQGRLPDNPLILEKEIEGIGRYTAGAICSMAYGVTTPIVDGNIHRLLCRLLGLHAPPTSPLLIKKLWTVAEMMVENVGKQGLRDGVVGDWNQALMEVGNQICKPVGPDCDACPVRSGCRAYAELCGPPPPPADEPNCTICCPPLDTNLKTSLNGGIPSVTIFPMKKLAKISREEMTAVCLFKWEGGDEDRWLMVKRPEKGLLAGLFEPPSALVPLESDMDDQILAARNTIDNILLPLSDNTTLSTPISCGSFLHVFSHINMTYSVHAITITRPDSPPAVRPEFVTQALWMTGEQVKHANIGTGTKKLWTMVYGPAAFGAGKATKSKSDDSKPTTTKRKKAPALVEEATLDGKIVKKIAMPSMPRRK